jgi:serine/threonine protein kinase
MFFAQMLQIAEGLAYLHRNKIVQIAEGLAYLHRNKIVHGDVKDVRLAFTPLS